MGRKRTSTRRTPKARPVGILELAPDGFGFVTTAEGEFFIPASKLGGACHGDTVEIAPAKQNAAQKGRAGKQGSAHNSKQAGKRPSARVLRVLNRANDFIIGRYEVADPFGVVVPQDPRINFDVFTMRSDNPSIPHGAIVRVRMREYPSRNTAATGVVEEVLGMEGQPGMDIEAIVARYKLLTRFSEAALQQAEEAQVAVEDALAAGYVDERDRFVFTIDPFDAKDFDDALSLDALLPSNDFATCRFAAQASPSCAPLLHVSKEIASQSSRNSVQTVASSSLSSNASWRLGIHIADVSHYVPWGSAIDTDAKQRTTSVYMVDRVIPMLPEALSNEICSLKPGQPRRTFTVDVILDENFKVLSTDFHLGIIESKARLSYDQAQCYIDAVLHGETWQDAAVQVSAQPTPQGALPLNETVHEALFNALQVLNFFAHARAAAREAAGGIDFETTEAKVQLDAGGQPTGVSLRTRTAATSCVEEAMILANECVAQHLRNTHTPGIFRVHDAPSADSLSALIPILQEFGYDAQVDFADFVAGNPQALQAVLNRAKGRAEAPLITSLLLRAQQRAVYKAEYLPHYGLASAAYCHFTSPIRRYPDLVVHRMLSTLAQGKTETYTAECDSLAYLAEHSSKMERIADDAARESQELKLFEYMQQFVGQEFEGIISGIATYGFFVQLDNTAEGLVPVRSLGQEYYSFDPTAYKLIGQDSGVVYRLGQRVVVRIVPAAEHARKLEFRLVR